MAKSAPVKPAEKKIAAPAAKAPEKKTVTKAVSKASISKAAAAAAGAGSGEVSVSPNLEELDLTSASDNLPSQPTIEAEEYTAPSMSSAVLDEPAVETFEPQEEDDAPRIAVDPMMAEGGPSGSSGTSFSEISDCLRSRKRTWLRLRVQRPWKRCLSAAGYNCIPGQLGASGREAKDSAAGSRPEGDEGD